MTVSSSRSVERGAAFWPCIPILDEESGSIKSIIFTEMDRLGAKHPRATSGYAVESLVKKLAKEEDPSLLRKLRFDPEADMFCAHGDDPAALLAIAKLLRKATGQKRPRKAARTTKLSADEARDALRRGFIEGLDKDAQRTFLEGWPRPSDPGLDAHLRDLARGDAKVRTAAARRILGAACRCVGRIDRALCHPTAFDAVIAAAEKEADPKVSVVIAQALQMLAQRAVPDLRTRPIFEQWLTSKRAPLRTAAVEGMRNLTAVDWNLLLRLLDDEVPRIRAVVCEIAKLQATKKFTVWVLEDTSIERSTPIPRAALPKLAERLADSEPAVQNWAAGALADIGTKEYVSELERQAKRTKVEVVRQVLWTAAKKLGGP